MNENIKKLGYFFITIFFALTLYLGYLNVFVGPKLSTDPHNRRLAAAEEAVIRGTIYDRNGKVLAEDRVIGGAKKRVYPLGRETAHLLGFVSQQYGRTGLESSFDGYLLAMDDAGRVQAAIDRLLNRQRYGYNVTLTVDAGLQRTALRMLGERSGAVVALDPRTGALLAMVSTPSFDPNTIDEVVRTESVVKDGKTVQSKVTRYDIIKTQSDSAPLLNRAARGLYPPGSTFKIITGAAALEDRDKLDKTTRCEGSITVEGFVLKDNDVHGNVDFTGAVAESCNSYFGELGLELGQDRIKKAARSFGFDIIEYDEKTGVYKGSYPVVNGEIPYNPGTLPNVKMGAPELASTAIGQGRTMVTPMQMALVASGIANRGVVMKPYVLGEVTRRGGGVHKKTSPEALFTALSPESAKVLAAAMEVAVKTGSASGASIQGIRVAGKTGSAQNPHGQTHAWFMGFAPAEEPVIAVAVIVENSGSGGLVSTPVAREIIREYLLNKV